MAEELLKLYAARKAVTGHAFSPDTHWQQEFADAFEYDLTPDQQAAIRDIRRDMESPTPMDRLLCGDVGYGKTEVAMRAAFKAVMDSKQVAFLAPTTVLAFQHVRTLQDRFAGFPVRIDMISRFRSKAEQKTVLADLAAGRVDIIVGTHRLLSKDVMFRDLGLLVVDEEQRFGVVHKERIKQLRKKVDVLTMTATPIPRTLNMSLAGIRDMSVIETPPRDRLSIQTHVVRFDQDVIARAIRTELERGGQVYFVHNRIESIHSIANLVARLVPEAKLAVGARPVGRSGPRADHDRLRRRTSSTCWWRRRSSRTDWISRTRTRSSSIAPTGTASRSSTNCAAASADPIGAHTRTCSIPAEQTLSADRAAAAGGHSRVQRPGERLPHRGARPRDSRRRQPARRRAERAHRGRRLRHLHEAARRHDSRAEGRRAGRRTPRDGQPAARPAHRRDLHPRHEPAAGGLSAAGERAIGGGRRRPIWRSCATGTARCRQRAAIWPNMPGSGWRPTELASKVSTARAPPSS